MKPAFARWSIVAILGAGAVAMRLDDPKEQPTEPIREPVVVEEKVQDFVGQLRAAPLSRQFDAQPFAPVDWNARRRVLPPAQIKPSIPQFPFRYAGHEQQRGGAQSLYLARGNDIFPVHVGEVIEGFRIDAVHSGRIDVTFVAGGQRLSVLLSSPSDPEKTASKPIHTEPPIHTEQPMATASPDASVPQRELVADVAAPETGPGLLPHSAAIGRSIEPGAPLGTRPTSSQRLGTDPIGSGRLGL